MTTAPERELAVPAITQYDVMTLLGATVPGEPVVVELRYAADDPVTVTLTLESVACDVPRRSWTFERRLLDVGTDEPVEAGCIRVAPVWCPGQGTAVLLELGDVVLHAELGAVRRFVGKVHRAVPAGSEWERLEAMVMLSDSSCFTPVA